MSKPLALIVEDDPDAATIFSKALQAAGFETEVAWAGDLALNRLKSIKPGVIVVQPKNPTIMFSSNLLALASCAT